MMKTNKNTSDQCFSCIHFSGKNHCLAFLGDKIPIEILTGIFDHTKKHPKQQTNILYTEFDFRKVKKQLEAGEAVEGTITRFVLPAKKLK